MATMFDTWLGLWRTGRRFSETMTASGTVINSRTQMMREAARDPIHGNYAELGRMMPEKVEAFAEAGASIMTDFCAIQLQNWTNWNQIMLAAMTGRAPTYSDWRRLAVKQSRTTQRAIRASGKALAPVHRAALANAKRLGEQ